MSFRLSQHGRLASLAQLPSSSKQEEVNELAVHPKGDYLAAADDSGLVKIYNTRTRSVEKTLRKAHTVRPS